MYGSLKTLVVSRDQDLLGKVETALADTLGRNLRTRLVVNGHTDPLYGVDFPCDVVILHLSHTWKEELEALARLKPEARPGLIVIGDTTNAQAMRLSMQAGARDFLPLPLVVDDLIDALARTALDQKASLDDRRTRVTSVINSKGGAGATLIAANVAHMMSAASNRAAALIDLDIQFGTLPLYLDLYPQRGLSEALSQLGELDSVALNTYFVKHASGLHVLGHTGDNSLHVEEVSGQAIEKLLEIASERHEEIVLDLPRRIDAASVSAIERSDHVVLVVQQSLTTLRDASRLLGILRKDLAVTRDRICIVVNRFDKNAAVTLKDIEKTLNTSDIVQIPNDFRVVSDCVNTGTPLYDYARNAPVTRALLVLQKRLIGDRDDAAGKVSLGGRLAGMFGKRASDGQ